MSTTAVWTLTPPTPQVGAPVTLTVTLPKKLQAATQLEEYRKTSTYWIRDLQTQTQGEQETLTLTVLYFKSGKQPLPPLPSTGVKEVEVVPHPILGDLVSEQVETAAKPSPAPSALPVPYGEIGFAFGGFLLLLALLFLAYRWWKWRARRKEEGRFLYERVVRDIKTKVQGIPANETELRHWAGLCSEALKGYSQRVTHYRFLDLTAEELVGRQKEWRPYAPAKLVVDSYLSYQLALDRLKFSPRPEFPQETDFFLKTLIFLEQWHELEQPPPR